MQNLYLKEANALFRLTNQGVNVQTIQVVEEGRDQTLPNH